jgi:hypothetical protein
VRDELLEVAGARECNEAMEKKGKWQIPVLIVGMILLAYFGYQMINTYRAAGGTPSTAVAAKAPDHVKTREPVTEDTQGTDPTPTSTPTATVGGESPTEDLASIDLPAGDVLGPLVAESVPTTQEGTEGGPSMPVTIGPELPLATLAGRAGPSVTAPAAPSGIASRVRKRGSGYPIILPERGVREESFECVGTITGRRRVAILRDLSASGSPSMLFVAEGERIPGPKGLVVARVEPGAVTIRTGIASTTLRVESAAEQSSSASAAGPWTGPPPLR